ncbi:pyruvate dehydrogenase (acetyl-transferring) kinase [Malassezia pachydermatis]
MTPPLRHATRFAVYGVPMDLLSKSLQRTPQPITIPYLLAHGGQPGKPPTADELLRSAKYTQQELPVRLARRVRQFYSLPFIVGTNPYIQEVARLYASSFAQLASMPPIQTLEDNQTFTKNLRKLVQDHTENVPTLARGFLECREYMDAAQVSKFLDVALHSRIGIRIIAEQHLALTASSDLENGTDAVQSPTSVGIIDTEMSPLRIIEHSCEYVQALCESTFDIAPSVSFEGDLDVKTVGIPVHLEYVMTELLKNSFRATTEAYLKRKKAGTATGGPPPIVITLANAPSHTSVRIRDEGGGIRPENMSKIFSYAFTTANAQTGAEAADESNDIMAHAMQSSMGTLAGLGYGLPLSRLYLGYFGDNNLDIVSLWGHVCTAAIGRGLTYNRAVIHLSTSRMI